MLNDFISLFFPNFCIGCQQPLLKGEAHLCTDCRFHLPVTDFHLHQDNELGKKFGGKIPLVYTLAYLKFTKSSTVQNILHSLKYDGNQEIGVMMGHWYGSLLSEKHFDDVFDLILPIPLHTAKLQKRGYNQSDCFAQGLSESLHTEWSNNILVRNRATTTQTRKKRFERWLNVEEIFEVKEREMTEDKHILLVDDVVTTGSTMESCLHILMQSGAKSLSIAALACA